MTKKCLTLSRSQRINTEKEFALIISRGTKCSQGPLLFHIQENILGHPRLGMSIPKRVGNAIKRNSIKRRCKEAFRIAQQLLPNKDIVITVRPHEVLTVNEYSNLIQKAVSG
jgi:ribonuclease P protein component|tara:strand:+ start:97 stop:432 length:336 start_codon:yes stop_codon:yes gene_type:complete